MKKQQQTLRFCHALLQYGANRCGAMANFVMSLASSPSLSRPVELSASPFCHYHYSNLTKILRDWQIQDTDFRAFIQAFIPPPCSMADGQARPLSCRPCTYTTASPRTGSRWTNSKPPTSPTSTGGCASFKSHPGYSLPPVPKSGKSHAPFGKNTSLKIKPLLSKHPAG